MPYVDVEQRRAYMRDWRARNPSKRWATRAPDYVRAAGERVRRAIKAGRLVRPDRCERCSSTGVRIEAAHRDYSQPLDVLWLCVPCHRAWDAAEPKTRIAGRDTMSKVGVDDALAALGIGPGQLADVFRREAARVLRNAADHLDHGLGRDVQAEDAIQVALDWLRRADRLEFDWELRNPDDVISDEARSDDTEATPRHADLAVVADEQDTRTGRK